MQGLLLLFLDKRDDFANKNEEFYNLSIKKILVTINGMSHQLFAAGLHARDIYLELKKYFYEKKHSNVTWEEFLTTKFRVWIDTSSNTDNTLHGGGSVVEKSGILPEIAKASEASGNLKCYMFSFEDAVAHISVTNPSGILTMEK